MLLDYVHKYADLTLIHAKPRGSYLPFSTTCPKCINKIELFNVFCVYWRKQIVNELLTGLSWDHIYVRNLVDHRTDVLMYKTMVLQQNSKVITQEIWQTFVINLKYTK